MYSEFSIINQYSDVITYDIDINIDLMYFEPFIRTNKLNSVVLHDKYKFDLYDLLKFFVEFEVRTIKFKKCELSLKMLLNVIFYKLNSIDFKNMYYNIQSELSDNIQFYDLYGMNDHFITSNFEQIIDVLNPKFDLSQHVDYSDYFYFDSLGFLTKIKEQNIKEFVLNNSNLIEDIITNNNYNLNSILNQILFYI